MKTILKLSVCLLLVATVNSTFAQQAKTTTQTKKQKNKSTKTGIDNKIAVSDQVQPKDKGTKNTTKKSTGISNK